LDQDFIREHTRHTLNRGDLLRMSGQAAYSGTAFWYSRRTQQQSSFFDILVKGLRNRPEAKQYFKLIIDTWDEIEPTIKSNRRFGSPLGLMTFTDDFRKYVVS